MATIIFRRNNKSTIFGDEAGKDPDIVPPLVEFVKSCFVMEALVVADGKQMSGVLP